MEALTRNTPTGDYSEIQNMIYICLKSKIATLETVYDKQFFLKEFIKYATNQEKADYFVDWLFGNNEILEEVEPTIVQSWKIAEMVNGFKEVYGEEAAEESIRICNERDNTDTKLKYQLKLDALGANAEKRQELMTIYMSGNHSWTNGQLSDSISGFTSKFISKDIKREYYAYFFDNLLESMRTYPQHNAKVSNRESNLNLIT
jgi:hypothetical protein